MASRKNILSTDLLEKFNHYYFELNYTQEQTRKALNLSFHHFAQLKELSGKNKVKPRIFLKDILSKYTKEEIITYFDKHSFNDTVKKFNMTADTLYILLRQENIHHSSQQKLNFRKDTCKQLYGVEHIFQRIDIRKKCEAPETIMKMHQTQIKNNLKKFGVKYITQREDVKQKIKETNLKKYGGGSWACSNDGRKRMSQIHLSKELQDKTNRTKKLNHSFNSSSIEKQCKEKLIYMFGEKEVEYQYKDVRYPFVCDFYIRSKDLFIELNIHWTHGDHPFDENNPKDIENINRWKSKAETSEFYKQAIRTWTIRDVNKIKKLKENNLNYIIIYPNVMISNNKLFYIQSLTDVMDNMRKQFLELPIKSITTEIDGKDNKN